MSLALFSNPTSFQSTTWIIFRFSQHKPHLNKTKKMKATTGQQADQQQQNQQYSVAGSQLYPTLEQPPQQDVNYNLILTASAPPLDPAAFAAYYDTPQHADDAPQQQQQQQKQLYELPHEEAATINEEAYDNSSAPLYLPSFEQKINHERIGGITITNQPQQASFATNLDHSSFMNNLFSQAKKEKNISQIVSSAGRNGANGRAGREGKNGQDGQEYVFSSPCNLTSNKPCN